MKYKFWLSGIIITVFLSVFIINQTQAQESLPDLIIQSITATHKLKKMAVVVKNQSQARAGRRGSARAVELAYWWVDKDGEHVGPVLTRWVPSLPANAKYTINFTKNTYPLPTLPKGAKELRFKVDYAEAIEEINEVNNYWKATPKSKNTALSATPWVEAPANLENPTYTVSPNQEPNQSTANPLANFNWENPTYNVTPNQPTQETMPTTNWEDPTYTTTPTQTTPATPSSSSSSSSSGASTTNTTPAAVNPAALPRANCMISVEPNPFTANADLILKPGSVYYTPKPAVTSKSVKFWATVLNVGAEPTGLKVSERDYAKANIGDSDIYLCLDTNNDGLWDIVKTTYNGPLDPEHWALTSMDWMTPKKGTHRYQICTDGGNKVIETNESNNCTAGTFTVN